MSVITLLYNMIYALAGSTSSSLTTTNCEQTISLVALNGVPIERRLIRPSLSQQKARGDANLPSACHSGDKIADAFNY